MTTSASVLPAATFTMTDEQLIELEVTDLAFDGKAVAKRDGKVVFLKGGLPGEIVRAKITRTRRRFDEGIVQEIVRKSDRRISAPCDHFETCGGCTWQDLVYEDQLRFKQKQVAACLERIGGLEATQVEQIIGSAEVFHYRNKMEFSFHAGDDGGFTLGLHRRGHFDEIFHLDYCHLQSDEANRIVRWFQDYVAGERIPVYDVTQHTGYMRFLVIREARRTGQIMVNIVTNYGEMPKRKQLVEEFTGEFNRVSTIVHNQNGQKSNIATGETEDILFGLGYIEEQLFDCTFRIRANSFFQTNSLQTETLYRTAFDMLEPQRTDRVLDLYCGTGSIGILLSRYVSSVVGVELVEDAITAARENALCNNVSNAMFTCTDAKDFLREAEHREDEFNVVVIDPPRAGLHPKALRRLLRMNPEKILYISCNPATFSRDAREITEAGYSLPRLQPVDMFPHTMHIEVVGIFYRR